MRSRERERRDGGVRAAADRARWGLSHAAVAAPCDAAFARGASSRACEGEKNKLFLVKYMSYKKDGKNNQAMMVKNPPTRNAGG